MGETFSSTAPAPFRVGAVVFDGFELLDLYGPMEMFGMLGETEGGVEITILSTRAGPVKSAAGPSGMADAAMDDCGGFDILLVPGGIGTRLLMRDAGFLARLRRLAEASTIVATVCTGSMLLAATGLLDGRRATSNKLLFKQVKKSAPNVEWVPRARWVEDGKFVTSSGVSAGTDMALALIAKLRDRKCALRVARRAEYLWNDDPASDPFAVE
ncbi:MAG TPA: DJ-1/PfpI family protein [Opitutales bacterium]|nr:DJ-1/PfpI family protein [Opitutales bacterium]